MIRVAIKQDIDAVFTLASKLVTSSVVEENGFSKSFNRVLELPHMHLAVVEVGSTIVGYVLGNYHPCFHASGNVAWVEEIFVESKFRGSGFGRGLMTHFENWAEGQDCQAVALATRRAAEFYQALYYQESASYFKKQLRTKVTAPNP